MPQLFDCTVEAGGDSVALDFQFDDRICVGHKKQDQGTQCKGERAIEAPLSTIIQRTFATTTERPSSIMQRDGVLDEIAFITRDD